MANEDIDKILNQIKKDLMDNDSIMAIYLINDNFSDMVIKKYNLYGREIIDYFILKISTDFYAYNLYKKEIGEVLDKRVNDVMDEMVEIANEDELLDYIRRNVLKFVLMINDYFKYCKCDLECHKRVMANVYNTNNDLLLSNWYSNFFLINYDFYEYSLDQKVIKGLYFIDLYEERKDLDFLKPTLKIEFESDKEINDFLDYMLSSVVASMKLNNENSLGKYKLDEVLKDKDSLYKNKDFNRILFMKYYDIYKGVKWFNFKDVRDNLKLSDYNLISKLDRIYIHPDDVFKGATDVYTLVGYVRRKLNFDINMKFEEELEDEDVVNYLMNVLNGDERIDFDFNLDNGYLLNIIKLIMASDFYEYANYTRDDLDIMEEQVYEYLDNIENCLDVIDMFDSDTDSFTIISKFLDYNYGDDQDIYNARKKIISDEKTYQVLKINPFNVLEYRRIYGILLPLETSKFVELGNTIIGIISDITSLEDMYIQDGKIMYEEISEMFLNEISDFNIDVDQAIGFIVTNIYSNLLNALNPAPEYQEIIKFIEDEKNIIEKLKSDYDMLGQFIFTVDKVNPEFINDDIMKDRFCKIKNKKKILKRINPFYEEDSALFN